MKRLLQINPNFQATTSQKIASALAGISSSIYEAADEYFDSSTLSLFNRATGNWLQTTSLSAIGEGGFDSYVQGAGFIYRNNGVKTHNYEFSAVNSEYTVIVVGQANEGTTSFLAPLNTDVSDSDYALNMYVTSGGSLNVYKNKASSAVRVFAEITNPELPHIYTLSFSADMGMKLYIDGVLAASNPSDKNLLTKSLARFPLSGSKGFGHFIIADVDMSKPEYQANLQLLHDTLMQHYAL